MKMMTIGKLAKASGVCVETIRYYERKGLLQEPMRSASGYRNYSRDSISRLRFIRRAKELGFSLAEINELLCLKASPDSSKADIKTIAKEKITDINKKIADLTRISTALKELANECDGCGPVNDCPILKALDQ
mgnify:CR=1 FL=1